MKQSAKNTATIKYGIATALLTMAGIVAAENELCANAANTGNYNTRFLQNFVTLKQGNDGWLFRDMDLKQQFGPTLAGMEKLVALNQLLKQRGTKLILAPVPTRAITHPEKLGNISYDIKSARRAYKDFIKALNRRGIATPKLYRLLEHTHEQPLFFARDHHWTSRGAEAVARLTADIITVSGKYRAIEKIHFTSSRTGRQSNNGSLKKAAEILCDSQYPNEVVHNYHTKRQDELDLFAETPEPQVVLVGTSNSKGVLNFNFSGFLSQYARVDVLNKAQSGSGQDQALKDYLTSREYRDNPPRFLVWELPGYYSLSNQSALDQILQHLGDRPKTARRK